jgi:hypothetical protein
MLSLNEEEDALKLIEAPEAKLGAAGGSVFVLYAACASAALWLGPRAVAAVLDDSSAVSPVFLLTCVGAAGTGMGVGWFFGAHGVGGPAMLFYWIGLGVLWIAFAGMAWWGGRRAPLIRRDWTLYCYALALLPLTTLPVVPLWVRLAPPRPDWWLITAANRESKAAARSAALPCRE